jgi:hypothetical protein
MRRALGMGHFSLKRLGADGLWGRVPLLGTLEDTLRKAPDTGISLHRGPFMSEGNLESGEGGWCTGDLNDEWTRALGMGHLFPRGLHKGNLEEGLLYWGP